MEGFARTLQIDAPDATYDLISLVDGLIDHAKSHISSNNVVVPVLQTFNVLLETDVLRGMSCNPKGLQRLVAGTARICSYINYCNSLQTLFAMASRNIPRLKNIQRILVSMKM
jgi:tubulin-specific chaperone D